MHMIVVASDGPRTKGWISGMFSVLKSHRQGPGHGKAKIGMVRVVVADVMGIQGIR